MSITEKYNSWLVKATELKADLQAMSDNEILAVTVPTGHPSGPVPGTLLFFNSSTFYF